MLSCFHHSHQRRANVCNVPVAVGSATAAIASVAYAAQSWEGTQAMSLGWSIAFGTLSVAFNGTLYFMPGYTLMDPVKGVAARFKQLNKALFGGCYDAVGRSQVGCCAVLCLQTATYAAAAASVAAAALPVEQGTEDGLALWNADISVSLSLSAAMWAMRAGLTFLNLADLPGKVGSMLGRLPIAVSRVRNSRTWPESLGNTARLVLIDALPMVGGVALAGIYTYGQHASIMNGLTRSGLIIDGLRDAYCDASRTIQFLAGDIQGSLVNGPFNAYWIITGLGELTGMFVLSDEESRLSVSQQRQLRLIRLLTAVGAGFSGAPAAAPVALANGHHGNPCIKTHWGMETTSGGKEFLGTASMVAGGLMNLGSGVLFLQTVNCFPNPRVVEVDEKPLLTEAREDAACSDFKESPGELSPGFAVTDGVTGGTPVGAGAAMPAVGVVDDTDAPDRADGWWCCTSLWEMLCCPSRAEVAAAPV